MEQWRSMNSKILKKKILMNVTEDREKATEFINNISKFLDNTVGITGEEYSKIMLSASKLMEVAQKSNEQIVKIFETMAKKKPVKKDDGIDKDIEKILQQSSGEVVES